MIIVCSNKECSISFKGKKSRKYCSSKCSNTDKYNKSHETIICNYSLCNKKFEARISKNQRFCSVSCSNLNTPKRSLEGSCNVCAKPISASRKYCTDHKLVNYERLEYVVNRTCKSYDCNIEFTTYSTNKLFCSKQCNNREYKRVNSKTSIFDFCACGKKISSYAKQCSPCFTEAKKQMKIDSWLNGNWNGGSETTLSKTIKIYLLEEASYKCSICGFDKMHPVDNKTVLEIDHTDGDASNHKPENLKVLCPNCHSLTPTYRNRNAGSGRKVFYRRVDLRTGK